MTAPRFVRMANQIAMSVPDRARVPAQTAAHLRAFWPRPMIDDLADYAQQHPDDVLPDVHAALEALIPEEIPHG